VLRVSVVRESVRWAGGAHLEGVCVGEPRHRACPACHAPIYGRRATSWYRMLRHAAFFFRHGAANLAAFAEQQQTMALLPAALHLEVVRFLPACWISGELVTAAHNAGHRTLHRALEEAPDRCHVCNQIVFPGAPYVLRVNPCGCLVHAPCALDDVVTGILHGLMSTAWRAIWHTCPRCTMTRCTNLEFWLQSMCIIEPRLFHI
jgi:hypothetical protein